MWIMANNAFVSIVQHRDKPDTLIVRARVEGDVERFFGWKAGDARVITTPAADYRFRAQVYREVVEHAMLRAARRVTYPNFKDSVATAWRKAISMRIWSIWHGEQVRRYGSDGGGSLWR